MVKQIMRTHQLEHAGNQSKLVKLLKILPEYQKSIKTVQDWQYASWLNGDGFWNRRDLKHLPTKLSQRYMGSVRDQTVAGLQSWEGLVQTRFKEIVSNSNLPPETKILLWRVNARKAWYKQTLELPETKIVNGKQTKTGSQEAVPSWVLKLARRIIKQVRNRHVSLPDLSKTRTLTLYNTVSQLTATDKGDMFDYWYKISTLDAGHPVNIPVFSNQHVESQSGQWAGVTQLTFQPDGGIVFKQVRKSQAATPLKVPADGSGTLGLDFGLRSLFATSQGTIHGTKLYAWLLQRDQELTVLTAALQRQNIKLSTNKRYKKFQHRIREHVVNEVNRVLNRILEVHNPAELVVESLDFRGGGLSRQLNRILSRAGRKTVKTKLAALQETRGIKVTAVPAPYSSQECSGCGWVDPASRKGTWFTCTSCGLKLA